MNVNKALLKVAEGTIEAGSIDSGLLSVNVGDEAKVIDAIQERIGNEKGEAGYALDGLSADEQATALCLAAAMGE
jgi:hypothetical protein